LNANVKKECKCCKTLCI